MARIEEKAKVGRPKLADSELIKDSWCRIGASLSIALVMVICGVGILTARTPWQVMTFQQPGKALGNVAMAQDARVRVISVDSLKETRVIKIKGQEKLITNVDGTVTRVIPATPTEVIKVN